MITIFIRSRKLTISVNEKSHIISVLGHNDFLILSLLHKHDSVPVKTSLNELGIMYAEGMGVEPDLEKAKEFWKKSEELGCEEAGENLKQLEEMKE